MVFNFFRGVAFLHGLFPILKKKRETTTDCSFVILFKYSNYSSRIITSQSKEVKATITTATTALLEQQSYRLPKSKVNLWNDVRARACVVQQQVDKKATHTDWAQVLLFSLLMVRACLSVYACTCVLFCSPAQQDKNTWVTEREYNVFEAKQRIKRRLKLPVYMYKSLCKVKGFAHRVMIIITSIHRWLVGWLWATKNVCLCDCVRVVLNEPAWIMYHYIVLFSFSSFFFETFDLTSNFTLYFIF